MPEDASTGDRDAALDEVDQLLDRGRRDDYPDAGTGRLAGDLAGLRGVVDVAVTEDDQGPAVAVRIDPAAADLGTVHLVAVDHEFRVVDEAWDRDEKHLCKHLRERTPEGDLGWWQAAEELAALAADHSPATVLDYWMLERGPPLPVTQSQSAWAEHRDVTQQAVSDSRSRIEVDAGE